MIGAILEESEVQVVECASGEAAVKVMEVLGDRAVFLFADVGLAGVMDGVDLACEVGDRWPNTRLVTTSGGCEPSRLRALPRGTKHFPKPWRALDLIIELEHAIASRQAASSRLSEVDGFALDILTSSLCSAADAALRLWHLASQLAGGQTGL